MLIEKCRVWAISAFSFTNKECGKSSMCEDIAKQIWADDKSNCSGLKRPNTELCACNGWYEWLVTWAHSQYLDEHYQVPGNTFIESVYDEKAAVEALCWQRFAEVEAFLLLNCFTACLAKLETPLPCIFQIHNHVDQRQGPAQDWQLAQGWALAASQAEGDSGL